MTRTSRASAKTAGTGRTRAALPRPRLDRAAVIQAAAELADRRGSVENLQLVDLAQRLSVRTPSLYAHVESLEDLRRGVALLGLAELRDRLNEAASGLQGAEALLALARAVREYALERPGAYTAYALAPRDPEWRAAQTSLKDVFVRVLSRYGIAGEDATECIRALRSSVHGFVTLELQGDFAQPDPAASFEKLVLVVLKGLLGDAPDLPVPRRRARVMRA
jgi:AcrR family transcriptional regulator